MKMTNLVKAKLTTSEWLFLQDTLANLEQKAGGDYPMKVKTAIKLAAVLRTAIPIKNEFLSAQRGSPELAALQSEIRAARVTDPSHPDFKAITDKHPVAVAFEDELLKHEVVCEVPAIRETDLCPTVPGLMQLVRALGPIMQKG